MSWTSNPKKKRNKMKELQELRLELKEVTEMVNRLGDSL